MKGKNEARNISYNFWIYKYIWIFETDGYYLDANGCVYSNDFIVYGFYASNYDRVRNIKTTEKIARNLLG